MGRCRHSRSATDCVWVACLLNRHTTISSGLRRHSSSSAATSLPFAPTPPLFFITTHNDSCWLVRQRLLSRVEELLPLQWCMQIWPPVQNGHLCNLASSYATWPPMQFGHLASASRSNADISSWGIGWHALSRQRSRCMKAALSSTKCSTMPPTKSLCRVSRMRTADGTGKSQNRTVYNLPACRPQNTD